MQVMYDCRHCRIAECPGCKCYGSVVLARYWTLNKGGFDVGSEAQASWPRMRTQRVSGNRCVFIEGQCVDPSLADILTAIED
jgi:hypothetical protein